MLNSFSTAFVILLNIIKNQMQNRKIYKLLLNYLEWEIFANIENEKIIIIFKI